MARRLVGGPCANCGRCAAKTRFCRRCGLAVCPSCFVGCGCHAAAMAGGMANHAAAERLAGKGGVGVGDSAWGRSEADVGPVTAAQVDGMETE